MNIFLEKKRLYDEQMFVTCRKHCRWVIVYSLLLCQMEVTSSLLLSKFRINIHFLMKNSNHFDFIID